MIEVVALLTDSVLLQAKIAEAMNAAKIAGDIERYGISRRRNRYRQLVQYPARPAFGSWD
jgi:hypothetical protein